MIQMIEKNVLGAPLAPCCTDPMTGFFRDGSCRTGPDDRGRHTVCARVTEEFLQFSQAAGNDLSTPMPEYAFPGSSRVTAGASASCDGERRWRRGAHLRCALPPRTRAPWSMFR